MVKDVKIKIGFKSSDFLGTDEVKPLIWKLAIPSIIAQVINMLYNIVDRIYIGHILGSGALALTGLGIAFPLIVFVGAFANIVSMGSAPKLSIALGKKDTNKAEIIIGNSFSFLFLMSIILMILILIYKRNLLFAFGSSVNTIEYADRYLSIYILGTTSVLFSIGLNAFIAAQGFTSKAMQTVIIGAILNIILDPIFIFVFNLGVAGAAYATIISQTVSALWVLYFLTFGNSPLKLRIKNLKINMSVFAPCLALGMAPFIMTSTESALIIVFNSSLQKYGGDVAVGAMTILSSVNNFVKMPMFGFDQGAQPVIGYNFGAAKKKRMIEAVKFMFLINISYAIVMFFTMEAFPHLYANVFTQDVALIKYVSWSLRIYILAFGIFGLQIAVQYFLISTGQAKISVSIAVLRKLVLLIPLILILPHFFENKVLAVFMAEPIADFISVTYAIIMYKIISKRLYNDMD
ncbi:MAG: MATE family efflux transporter [Spirochaetaceae bacterium]|nr:MATE family efflux transporter [Spirochaetaceae bacterium]